MEGGTRMFRETRASMRQICLSPFLPKLATSAYTLVVLLKRHVSMSIYVRHPTEPASWAANESQ
jgi:hypothetical protein